MPNHHDQFDEALEGQTDLYEALQQTICKFASEKKMQEESVYSSKLADYISKNWGRYKEFRSLFPSTPEGEMSGMLGIAIYRTLDEEGWSTKIANRGSRRLRYYVWEEKESEEAS